MTFGLPGMQVRPLERLRKTTVCPCASLSMIFADPAIPGGPSRHGSFDFRLCRLACLNSIGTAA